jgi:outer membrane protein TolC
MGAEQSVIEARAQLGIVMGIAANAIDTLPLPATDFPAMRDTVALLPPGADSSLGDPLLQRADYAAAGESERAAAALAASTQNDLRPRLDLTLGMGYVGTANGYGVGHFIAPLYQNVPGLNASVQITYQLPITNTGAEGRAVEQAAAYEQQRIVRADLARRIRSNVAVAQSALAHGHAALVESHEAVSLAQTTVKNEQRKFRLDASTMFDVIQAQDALTNAQLNEITSAQRYAVAIATLRFESGGLASRDPASTVDVQRLLTPP